MQNQTPSKVIEMQEKLQDVLNTVLYNGSLLTFDEQYDLMKTAGDVIKQIQANLNSENYYDA